MKDVDGLMSPLFQPLPLAGNATLAALTAGVTPVALTVRDDPDGPARSIQLHLCYPGGQLANVRATTGLMLDLHNWGGVTFEGAPAPEVLADSYDVVAIGVTYYQSGDKDDPKNPVPYDCGCIQAMDALRALHFVYASLTAARQPFDRTRLYGTGGSGGGNVILMANKFAPRTFACIVDLSGMASLTDDIAYGQPGGSILNARYSRDPASPAYLTRGMQEIRDTGNPAHLALQAKAGNRCRVVVIHGEDDDACPAADKRRVVNAMGAAGLTVDAHMLTAADVDGTLVRNSGHALGNRTALLRHFADDCLTPGSPKLCRLAQPCDFDRRETVSYPTQDGVYAIAFGDGGPVLTIPGARGPHARPQSGSTELAR